MKIKQREKRKGEEKFCIFKIFLLPLSPNTYSYATISTKLSNNTAVKWFLHIMVLAHGISISIMRNTLLRVKRVE